VGLAAVQGERENSVQPLKNPAQVPPAGLVPPFTKTQ